MHQQNTTVSAFHGSGAAFLLGGHIAGTGGSSTWERTETEDVDPHGVARSRDWKPSEVTFLTAHAGDALERLIGTGRASTSGEAAERHFNERPKAFVKAKYARLHEDQRTSLGAVRHGFLKRSVV